MKFRANSMLRDLTLALALMTSLTGQVRAEEISSKLLGNTITNMKTTMSCATLLHAIRTVGKPQSDGLIAVTLAFIAFSNGTEAAGGPTGIEILDYCANNSTAKVIDFPR